MRFAVAAALTLPDRRVIAVVANNGGWNIERRDQIDRFGGDLVVSSCPAAATTCSPVPSAPTASLWTTTPRSPGR